MKHFRFIMVPDGMESPRQVRVSARLIRFGLAIFAIFVILNMLIAGWNIWHLGNSAKVARLRSQRDKLESHLANLRQNMDSLANELATISQRNRAIYVSAAIPEPEHGYAVGGRHIANIDESSFSAKMAFSIDSLRFIVRQEASALAEAEEQFAKREKILRHTPSIKPMNGFIISGFGKRIDPLTGTWKMHEGIDICAPKGTPVYATADGKVKSPGRERGFGKVVIIDHIWYETRYAHLDEILVTPGQKIKRGDLIGKCGRTGRTTGMHLHYEIRVARKPINPMAYILPQKVCVD